MFRCQGTRTHHACRGPGLELIDDAGHRAIALAQSLGLAQEALRLGANVVGTEHLLMATLCDPVIRWKVASVGVDMRDVQNLVRGTVERRRTETALGFALTAHAARLCSTPPPPSPGWSPARDRTRRCSPRR